MASSFGAPLGKLLRKGVGMIPGVDLPEEKRKRVMGQAFTNFEQNIAGGMDAQQAQINALAKASAGLASEGFVEDANALRMQLVQLVQAEETRQLNINKIKADTAFTKARTEYLGVPDAANVINMVKLDPNDPAAAPDFASVAANNPTRVQELIDQGYLEMSPISLGAEGTTLGEAAGWKVVTRETQEALMGQLSMLSGLKVLRAGAANTGLLEGPARGLAAKFGMSLPGEQGASALDMIATRRKMRADVQSIIKGIPSNYDASVFEVTIPNPFAFASQPLYTAQVDLLERETRALVSGTIAFHKYTDKPIPEPVVQAARNLGVNIESVRPWDGQGDPLGSAISMQGTRSALLPAAQAEEFNPFTATPEERAAFIKQIE